LKSKQGEITNNIRKKVAI